MISILGFLKLCKKGRLTMDKSINKVDLMVFFFVAIGISLIVSVITGAKTYFTAKEILLNDAQVQSKLKMYKELKSIIPVSETIFRYEIVRKEIASTVQSKHLPLKMAIKVTILTFCFWFIALGTTLVACELCTNFFIIYFTWLGTTLLLRLLLPLVSSYLNSFF